MKDVLFDATGNINLIATADLNTTNWDVNFSMHPFRSGQQRSHQPSCEFHSELWASYTHFL
eukprot:2445007-Rhodomonas_salina.1